MQQRIMKLSNTNTMKTTIKKSGNKGILFTMLLMFTSICLQAEESNMIIEMIYKNMSGIYIICTVLGFGLVLLAITKIASRYTKDPEVNQNFHQNSNRVNAHRMKHHQKIIKKSS